MNHTPDLVGGSRLFAVAFALLAALAIGCAEEETKSAAGSDASTVTDIKTDLGAPDGASDGAVKLPGVPTDVHIDILPAGQAKMTPQQRQHAMNKLKAGGEFVDMHMRAEVVPIVGKAAEQVVVEPNQLSFPKAGNEALLALKPGAPLVADRSATNITNPFGILRKVKSVKEVAGQIVIETEPARLGEVLVGAASLKIEADDLQVLDTSGVDEGMYFPTWDGIYVPQVPKMAERKRWGRFRAPLKDLDVDLKYTGDWSASGSFNGLTLNVEKNIGNVKLSLSGTSDVTVDFSFKPSFYLQVGVDFLDFEYFKVGASGQLDLKAAIELELEAALGIGTDKEESKGIADALAKDPVKPAGKKLTIVELGPFSGPPIPMSPPIPTTFMIDVVADCSLTIYGTVKSRLEGGVSTGGGFGISWEEADDCSSSSDCWTTCGSNGKCGSGWQATSDANFSKWHNVTVELGGGIVAECGIQPQLQWLIGGIAGPMAGVRGAVRGTLAGASICPPADTLTESREPDLQTSLTFDVGASVLVGGKIDLIVPGLEFDFSVTVYEYWWTIWQKVWDFPQGGFGWCSAACLDGIQDYAESDVDCGGICKLLCAEGKKCKTGADCATYNCSNSVCGPILCTDGKKSGSETDVDCGGYCPTKCPVGKACTSHADCGTDASGAALGCSSLTQLCALPTCKDGWQGPTETGVDCGGTCDCQPLVGCGTGGTCSSGFTCTTFAPDPTKTTWVSGASKVNTQTSCLPNEDLTCMKLANGIKDGSETAADCGGTCAGAVTNASLCAAGQCGSDAFRCADGLACVANADCLSGLCKAGKCAQHCADKVANADETDIDCGGSKCTGCALKQKCYKDLDCGSGMLCSADAGSICVAATCSNGVKDGDESDKDCGGTCPTKCATGAACKVVGDCISAACGINLVCVATLCENGIKDPGEFAPDCGGTCPLCANGGKCTPTYGWYIGWQGMNTGGHSEYQCLSNYCAGYVPKVNTQGTAGGYGICWTPTCTDEILNGTEGDIDCGGSCDTKCAVGQKCKQDEDCATSKYYAQPCTVDTDEPFNGSFPLGYVEFQGQAFGQCIEVKNNKKLDNWETDVDCGGYIKFQPKRCADGLKCLQASDCASGYCSKDKVCLAPTCPNGILDGGETAIDCGGSAGCPTKCAIGVKCKSGTDCASGFCHATAKTCVATSCEDGLKSGDELGIDCGGGCPKCALGVACSANEACETGSCHDSKKVCIPSCKDGIQNGDETYIDCGGGCEAGCELYQPCVGISDCKSNACHGSYKLCAPNACSDKLTSLSVEAGVDCGKTCPDKCSGNTKCYAHSDCKTGVCAGLTTATGAIGSCTGATTCLNSTLDGDETDVDCGGTCGPCGSAKKCKVNVDCTDKHCIAGICKTDCQDTVKDWSETDVDCGGTCSTKCAVGKVCKSTADCISTASCVAGLCASDPCKNAKKDTAETDVDCGAVCGIGCALNLACSTTADCATTLKCVSGKCKKDNCFDGKKGDLETDKDCGGGTCVGCGYGKLCTQASDCDGYDCIMTASNVSKCTDSCGNGFLDDGEVDLDCGGACPTKCADGKKCKVPSDCEHFCSALSQLCVTNACGDGLKDGDETDVDCGGTAKACTAKCAISQGCLANTDCASGFCSAGGLCVATACQDGKKSNSETDVDCGGSVCGAPCAVGLKCKQATDCISSVCDLSYSTCMPSPCTDGVKGGTESDVDCGGSCAAKCLQGKACAGGSDCQSGVCSAVSKLCVADTCGDELLTKGESDVDCGKVCNKGCADGKTCASEADCQSAACSAGLKCVADTCSDGKLTVGESDLDCGGNCTTKCAIAKGCTADGDCQSGACSVGGKCVASICENGKLDGGETGIDCGGGCAGKCKSGDPCGGNGDCQSNICAVTNLCVATTCQDGIVSGGESDVDCGGSCTQKCGASAKCKTEGDCASGACSTGGLCVANACLDGKKNGDEGDIDCGGSCSKACDLNQACKLGADCGSGVCSVGGKCVASTCLDGKLSGNETGLDCGGTCSTKCGVGVACAGAGDCQSAQCSVGGKCVATACENGVKDGSETALDCGGSCAKCSTGLACGASSDCVSSVCSVVSKVCVADTCKDEQKSGSETDVDCGGSCAQKCVGGKVCAVNGDCASAQCGAGNACVGSACDNGKLDSGESDIDCGGSCPACGIGKACSSGGNCASGVCSVGKLCVASTCEDGLKTTGEGDVDCGGACATKCALSKGCASGSDCGSGVCSVTKLCVASSCVDGMKSGSETDVDCGGTCSNKCALAKACKTGGDCASSACGALSLVCVASTCVDQALTTGETDIDCGGTCSAKCLSGKKCKLTTDCAAGVCNGLGVCAADYCSDGLKNGAETDVDCGGSCSQKCGADKLCSVGGDCTTGVCSVGGKCVASLCFDGIKDNGEGDIDCGGSCAAKCAAGKKCAVASDCQTAYCPTTTKVCAVDPCLNGIKDNGEGDIDCGGSCAAKCATGKTCAVGTDCQTTFCSPATKLCAVVSCHDGARNGTETDVDCGGSCVACGRGQLCKLGSDCDSGYCATTSRCGVTCFSEMNAGQGTPSLSVWLPVLAGYNITYKAVTLTENEVNDTGRWFNFVDALQNKPVTISLKAILGSSGGVSCGEGIVMSIVNVKDEFEFGDYYVGTSGTSCLGYGNTGGCAKAKSTPVQAIHIELDTVSNSGVPVAESIGSEHVAVTLNGDPATHIAWAKPPVSLVNGTGATYKVTISGSTVTVWQNSTQLFSKTIPGWTFAGGLLAFSGSTSSKACLQRFDTLNVTQGTCSAAGTTCSIGNDCASGVCSAVSKKCVADTCSDQKISGKEGDIDCGGTCTTKCATGKLCYASTDCTSGTCLSTGKCK